MADISCKNRAMALTALDTIAATMQGTQRAAVLAVKAWVRENTNEGFISEETIKKLNRIFNAETEGQRKAREWQGRGAPEGKRRMGKYRAGGRRGMDVRLESEDQTMGAAFPAAAY